MIVVTGATGQLGWLVIDELLKFTEGEEIIAAVREPAKAVSLVAHGSQVRKADYSQPETLATAFVGATGVLLASGSDLNKRVTQHKAVIDAAKVAGAGLSRTRASCTVIPLRCYSRRSIS